ncbi:MAG: lipopolysaccharide heptosyltransferase II [Phycisphaerales bacterium]|nr:MAG: lipopolysaccharide heptosyltransferase II [Phycisphaerales bacterium]
MATPVFECLRANLPQAKIIAMLKKGAQGILRDSPWIDGFVEADDKSWSGFCQMRRQLRECRPDAAILLTNSLRSALTMRLSGVRTVYGYRREWRGPLLAGGPTVSRNAQGIIPVAMVDYYLQICRWLDLEIPSVVKPKLFISEALRQRGGILLQQCGIGDSDFVVGLNPGASFGPSKCWPAEYFAQLAELCQERLSPKIVIFSGPGEEAIVRALLDHTKADLIDLRDRGVDLELLKPLIQRCNLMITNDTGPRHYAVAFGVPTVVIMGPTDPRYTASNLEHTVVVRKELPCSPCHKKTCPLEHHKCMREITPAEVFAAAEALLNTCV